jgi:hypothetical protein
VTPARDTPGDIEEETVTQAAADDEWAGPVRPAVLAWALWLATLAADVLAVMFNTRLLDLGSPDSGPRWFSLLSVVPAVGAATLGGLIVVRRPGHPVGWLLACIGFTLAVGDLLSAYTHLGATEGPGTWPLVDWLAGFESGTFPVWLILSGFVLLLTPDGRLPSRRWRWPARLAVAVIAVWLIGGLVTPQPFEETGAGPVPPGTPVVESPIAVHGLLPYVLPVFLTVVGCMVAWLIATAFSLAGRARRATGAARQQLRWLTFAGRVVMVFMLVALVFGYFGVDPVVGSLVYGNVLLVMLATAASITRYRLYDLDRIISRTLSYTLLTVLLGGFYALVALGLGHVLAGGSSLLVAAATLAAAALFQPLRRWVQGRVDRRYNRRRYDAERTVHALRDRLRDEVDLVAVNAELLAAVERTMQPTRASMWLRAAQEGTGS